MILRALTALAALSGALLGAVPPALAVEPPTCWNAEVWARAEVTRTYSLYCPRTERVVVLQEPTASRFEGLVQGESVRFRLTPELGAPERDELVLRLSGAGGDTDLSVVINNVPPTRNTPPRCQPVSTARRTSGSAPEALAFHVLCWDDEHDDYTLHGGGPGRHLDAPLLNAGGESGQTVPHWRYLPTIAAGEEQTTYYAVDTLGARSADAPISVRLGPDVDRLPRCTPPPEQLWLGFLSIHARPGLERRFSIICSDADGDALTARVRDAPTRGELTRFDVQHDEMSYDGMRLLWIDAAYRPHGSFEGVDRFTVQASGLRGYGPPGDLGIVARPLPHNSGAGCGWGGGRTTPGTPVILSGNCYDDDGDTIVAEVAEPPAHGTADQPLLAPDRFGREQLTLVYRPEPGFEGIDYIGVDIGDAAGLSHRMEFMVVVSRDPYHSGPPPYMIGAPFDWPELRPTGPTWMPTPGQSPPVSPIDQARRALGTRGVRLVARIGDARVYAQRGALPATARRALAITCPVRCTVSARTTVVGDAAGRARLRVSPGTAEALRLKLSRAQRERVRSAARPRASFRIEVRRSGRRARSRTVRLAMRG